MPRLNAISCARTSSRPTMRFLTSSAVWLRGKGRLNEAVQNLNAAIATNRTCLDAPHLLMQIYADQGNADGLRLVAQHTLAISSLRPRRQVVALAGRRPDGIAEGFLKPVARLLSAG
jgi:hypothetical protein